LLDRFAANGSHAFLGAFGTSFFYRFAHLWSPTSTTPPSAPTRGLVDLAYASLASTEYPGYGYMLATGATSLYEHWATPWELTSNNHAWLGSVSSFMRGVVGGIAPAPGARGFDRIRLRPVPPLLGSPAAQSQAPGERLSNAPLRGGAAEGVWANTTYESVRGLVSTAWRLEALPNGTFQMYLRVQLPPNVAAEAILPLTAPIFKNATASAANPPVVWACPWAPKPTIIPDGDGTVSWVLVGITECWFYAHWDSRAERLPRAV
jgi:hypothetical protein